MRCLDLGGLWIHYRRDLILSYLYGDLAKSFYHVFRNQIRFKFFITPSFDRHPTIVLYRNAMRCMMTIHSVASAREVAPPWLSHRVMIVCTIDCLFAISIE